MSYCHMTEHGWSTKIECCTKAARLKRIYCMISFIESNRQYSSMPSEVRIVVTYGGMGTYY